MAKLGISLKIDVTKIDKARLFAAQSGAKYIDLTTFIDTDNEGQYGDHGFIAHSQTKQERENKTNTVIVGNSKVFWSDLNQQPQQQQQQQMQTQAQQQQSAPQYNEPPMDFDDDIPF